MRLHHIALLLLASTAVAQTKIYPPLPCDIPNSQVSLCVTAAIGSCGYFCQPFDCVPNYTLVSRGERVRFDIGGSRAQPYVLFSGSAVPGCAPVAGIEGALGLWADIFTVAIGLIYDLPPPGGSTCETGTAVFFADLPASMPMGTDFRFQVLGINTYCRSAPTQAFSRATELRSR